MPQARYTEWPSRCYRRGLTSVRPGPRLLRQQIREKPRKKHLLPFRRFSDARWNPSQAEVPLAREASAESSSEESELADSASAACSPEMSSAADSTVSSREFATAWEERCDTGSNPGATKPSARVSVVAFASGSATADASEDAGLEPGATFTASPSPSEATAAAPPPSGSVGA